MKRVNLFLAMFAAAIATACATPLAERFYTLAPDTPAQVAARPTLKIAVAAVSVPEAVDRPQLVFRNGATGVRIAEQERWAEPLRTGMARVLAADLAGLLGTSLVASYPQAALTDPDFRVAVDIQRFDATPGGAVEIDALWTIRPTGTAGAAGGVAITGHSQIRETADGSGVDGVVRAASRALGKIGRDIATAVPR